MIDGITTEVLAPPALRAEAFDEQQLKAEWFAACEDEQDAVARKQAVLRKALARWPMVPQLHPQRGTLMKSMKHSPEMRRFVRDVLGMPDHKNGSMNSRALILLKEGGREAHRARLIARHKHKTRLRQAFVALDTKFKLGDATAEECWLALHKVMEDYRNEQA